MKEIRVRFPKKFKFFLLIFLVAGCFVSEVQADYYNGSGSVPTLGSNPVQPPYDLRRHFHISNAELFTYATMNSIGLSLKVPASYYESYKPHVRFRKVGDQSWNLAHELTTSEKDRERYSNEYWWYGSIVNLTSGTEYEISVNIGPEGDPDLIDGQFAVRTRAETGSGVITKTMYVSATIGNDDYSGTQEAPLLHIQTALDRATPGTMVKVLPGVYSEPLVISQSGTSNDPIVLEGGPGVVLDGHRVVSGTWTHDGDALYYISFGEYPSSVDVGMSGQTEDRKRLYEYCAGATSLPVSISSFDLDDLRNRAAEVEDLSVDWCPHYRILGGWHFDEASGRLYVRAPDDSNPNDRSVWVGSPATAITIKGSYVIVQGFDIRYFKRAISCSQRRFNIVRDNRIFRCLEGIYFLLLNSINGEDLTGLPSWSEVGTAGYEDGHYAGCLNEGTLIEYNSIVDPDTYAWGYGRGKSKPTIETTGIQVSGPGTIVRSNYVKGYFKGISASWDVSQANRDLTRDLDIHDNIVCESMSDAFEPEGNLINARFWHNAVRDMWIGISIAPVRYGPMYVFGNIMFDHGLTAFKLSSYTKGRTYLYNNTVKTTVPGVPGWRDSGYWSNVTWKNNIIICEDLLIEDETGSSDNGLDLDYNLYYTPYSYTGWPEGSILKLRRKWCQTVEAVYEWFGENPSAYIHRALEKNGLFGNVSFVAEWPADDLPNDDTFRPVVGSPNINKGEVISNFSSNYSGSGPDIGAIEFDGDGDDDIAPVISGTQVMEVTSDFATIAWTTNEPASTLVEYGLTASYGQSVSGSNGVTQHEVSIDSLYPETLYHYRVISEDAYGNIARSDDGTFRTLSSSDLVINGTQVMEVTFDSVTIAWTTNEPASTLVEYGLTASYGQSISGSNGVIQHQVSIDSLSPDTLYHYRVISEDASANTACSDDGTFRTLTTSEQPIVGGKINFQPAGRPIPDGFDADYGYVWDNDRGYGWGRDVFGKARDKNVNPDQLLDTYIYADDSVRTWEVGLPNGEYQVSLSVGEPEYVRGNHKVLLEGNQVIYGSTQPNEYITIGNHIVNVTDGRLTVQIGGGEAVGGQDPWGLTNLNYIIIESVSGSALPPPNSLSAQPTNSIELLWSNVTGAVGYNLYRSITQGIGYVKINSDPVTGTSYVDKNTTPGVTYYYVVTSLNSDGVEGSYSPEASCTEPLAPPANQAPQITGFTAVPSSLNNPGESTTFNVSATDPDGDLLTYTIDFGDGTANGSGSQVVHTYEAEGIYTAEVTVDDGNGHIVCKSLQIAVNDVPPAKPTGVTVN